MANNKDKKPKDFKGVNAVLSTQDRIGYKVGDVIDFVMDELDVGTLVWDDPRFEVVFIKNKTIEEMKVMLEPLTDGSGKKVTDIRRKYYYDVNDVKIKDKAVWEKTDSEETILERTVDVEQPPEIVIP